VVQTGIRTKDSIEITSGLKEGDAVITSGGYGVPDKTEIKVEAAPADNEPASDGKGDDKSDAKPDGAKPAAKDPADKAKE
jgi:hypothetical protein